MREHLPLPPKIQNAPELLLGQVFYFGAFLELNTDRYVGMELGPIPWSSIMEYADRLGLDDEEREDLFHHVRALDDVLMEHRRKKTAPRVGDRSGGKHKDQNRHPRR